MSGAASITAPGLLPVAPAAGELPQQVVDRITGGAKSSFDLGMKLLPHRRREAMRAVYAFCRIVDDIADGDLPAPEKRAALAAWRDEIACLFEGRPESAIGQALLGPVMRYDLPAEEFLLLIDGMEMDAKGPILAPEWEDLERYNRRVAGTVGLLSMRIFGAWRGAPSHDFALSLADALQCTNILRDVEEDAARGRIYLPREALERAGVTPDPATIAADPNLPAARADLAVRTRHSFHRARAAIGLHARLRLAPALAMLGVYEGYLDRMEAQKFAAPPVMGRAEKLRRGLAALLARPA